jgi:intein/homing endonuclease
MGDDWTVKREIRRSFQSVHEIKLISESVFAVSLSIYREFCVNGGGMRFVFGWNEDEKGVSEYETGGC